jgi:hypothetical protein
MNDASMGLAAPLHYRAIVRRRYDLRRTTAIAMPILSFHTSREHPAQHTA